MTHVPSPTFQGPAHKKIYSSIFNGDRVIGRIFKNGQKELRKYLKINIFTFDKYQHVTYVITSIFKL